MAPVIAPKTLPLVLRAATPTSPIIITPAPTITVVTTLGSTLLTSPPSSDPQKSPVNFQPVIQTSNQGAEPVRVIPNSTVVVSISSVFLTILAGLQTVTIFFCQCASFLWVVTLVRPLRCSTHKRDSYCTDATVLRDPVRSVWIRRTMNKVAATSGENHSMHRILCYKQRWSTSENHTY